MDKGICTNVYGHRYMKIGTWIKVYGHRYNYAHRYMHIGSYMDMGAWTSAVQYSFVYCLKCVALRFHASGFYGW